MHTTLNRIFLLIGSLILSSCAAHSSIPNITKLGVEKECVVLVHGLWRSGFAMRSIASDLESYGYATVSVDYPSTSETIPSLSNNYLDAGIEECRDKTDSKVHIVTHSMGGILIRHYLQDKSLPPGSKVVMLSPPNQGSELSEKFYDAWWYQLIVGPAGSSLTNSDNGIINKLNPVSADIGIIAAYRSWSLWPESWLPEPNDGTVSVESMKLEEMNDFILVQNGHAMMRYDNDIQAQIRHYLSKGEFYR